MVWKEDENMKLGGDVMSDLDILKLNTYYKCPNHPTLKPWKQGNNKNIFKPYYVASL